MDDETGHYHEPGTEDANIKAKTFCTIDIEYLQCVVGTHYSKVEKSNIHLSSVLKYISKVLADYLIITI